MENFYQIMGLLGAVFIIWILYRYIKAQPQQLSRENLSKSFGTMGGLAVLLILFVAFLVFMLRG
jgi:hypothetical protein